MSDDGIELTEGHIALFLGILLILFVLHPPVGGAIVFLFITTYFCLGVAGEL